MAVTVLEREAELACLDAAVQEAAGGRGTVLLVSGEAGIGKSSLLDELASRLPTDARLLVGHCDDLATPRVLGPFRDLLGSVGGQLSAALRDLGDRDRFYTALLGELDWRGHATVLAVEDVHWADEATLDTLRYLVRRATGLPLVLVLTFRDDLPRDHPLHRLLAVAGTAAEVVRLPLRPLSADGVRRLADAAPASARASGPDPGRLHALTGGNPFLVSELVAAGSTGETGGVPRSVVDSVLARLHALPPVGRDAVERLSVVTAATDHALVAALVPGGLTALAEAEELGIVSVSPRQVRFRHEIIRRAVVDALPVARRMALNGAVLAVLEDRTTSDPASLVHHAAQAGDEAGIVRHGPGAARASASAGAHREALAHYELVLEHRSSFPPEELADLLEACAIECYTVGNQQRTATGDMAEAVALRRTLPLSGGGGPVVLGLSLRWLSRICWWTGEREGAERAGAEAVEVLEAAGAMPELALALSNLSQLAMLAERYDDAVAGAERAIALARLSGQAEVLTHAMNNLGTARWGAGDETTGRALLEESLDVARGAGLSEHAARACCNLV